MVFKWLILFAVFWVANAEKQYACEIKVAKIQNLIDKGTAFRANYDFGMENQNRSDPEISEAFVKQCVVDGGEQCCLKYIVANSTHKDSFHGCYGVGDKPDQIKNGRYSRRRWNTEDDWYFVSNEEKGFYDNPKFSFYSKRFNLSIHNLTGDIDVMMSQVSDYSADDEDFLRDMFKTVHKTLNFYHNLSDEDKKIQFKSDYNNDRYSSVNNYKSIDDDEAVYFETRHDGSQLGEYRCEMFSFGACVIQKFVIKSGKIVISGEPDELERCYNRLYHSN